MAHEIFEKIYQFKNPQNSGNCGKLSYEIFEIYEDFSSENTVEQKAIFFN